MTSIHPTSAAAPAAPPETGWRRNALVQGWLVLLLALVFGAVLATVELALGPAIAANKRNETLSRIPELVPGPDKSAAGERKLEIETRMLPVARAGQQTIYRVYRAVRGDRSAGWVVQAFGQGYADRIEILLGLNPTAATITGLFVLEQKETPGLGNKIASVPWRARFVGKSTAVALEAVKGEAALPHQIDAITGATISSRSVTAIVNRVLTDLKDKLAAESGRAES
jgi:electron transport complex protein RnfG